MFREILRHYFQVPKKHVSNCWGRKWVAFVSEFLSPVLPLKELNRSVTQPVNTACLTWRKIATRCTRLMVGQPEGGSNWKDNLKSLMMYTLLASLRSLKQTMVQISKWLQTLLYCPGEGGKILPVDKEWLTFHPLTPEFVVLCFHLSSLTSMLALFLSLFPIIWHLSLSLFHSENGTRW